MSRSAILEHLRELNLTGMLADTRSCWIGRGRATTIAGYPLPTRPGPVSCVQGP